MATAGGRKRKSIGKGKQVAGSVRSVGKEKTVDGREGTGEAPDDDDDDDHGGEAMVDDGDVEDKEAERKKLASVLAVHF